MVYRARPRDIVLVDLNFRHPGNCCELAETRRPPNPQPWFATPPTHRASDRSRFFFFLSFLLPFENKRDQIYIYTCIFRIFSLYTSIDFYSSSNLLDILIIVSSNFSGSFHPSDRSPKSYSRQNYIGLATK